MKKLFSIILQNSLVLGLLLASLATLNYLVRDVSLRIDFTADQEYTLSDSTKKILGMLEDRLTVKLYYSKNLPPQFAVVGQKVSDLLGELKANTKQKIIIDSVQPDLNEDTEKEAMAAGIVPLEVNTRQKDKVEVVKSYMGMVIYYRDKKETIPVLAQVDNLEYQVALSLLKLAGKKLPKIGILAPEPGSSIGSYRYVSEIAKLLATAVPVSAGDEKIAQQNLNTLVIIEPRSLSKEFLENLDNLVDDGLNVMIFAGKQDVDNGLSVAPIDTGMDEWFKNKGLTLSDKFVLDVVQNEKAAFQEGMMQLVMDYPLWLKAYQNELDAKNPITSRLEEIFLPWGQVLEQDADYKGPWSKTVLVRTSDKSFMQEHDVPNVGRQSLEAMVETPRTGSHPVVVLMENGEQKKSGRILVVSNFQMLRDDFFRQAQSNFVFVQNAMEYLSWGEYVIGIRSRGQTSRPIARTLDADSISWLKLAHVAGIPVMAILLGVAGNVISGKRRRKKIAALVGGM